MTVHPRLRYERRDDTTEIELLATRGAAAEPTVVWELTFALQALAQRPDVRGSTLVLAADHPAVGLDPLPEAVADAAGLTHRRDLFELRRPLPVPTDHPARGVAPPIAPRPFVPPGPGGLGGDAAAWIRANNRAFATHPDQGRETPASLADRTSLPWFDPMGFLVLDDPERPGELAGFCWTKVHPPNGSDPALGEIYVIGVDPTRQGEGLGPALVLAGLDHLADRGLETADLYVEADNEPALRLYDRLGFTVHQRRRVYTA